MFKFIEKLNIFILIIIVLQKYYNFLSPFFNILQRKINIFENFDHHQMVVF